VELQAHLEIQVPQVLLDHKAQEVLKEIKVLLVHKVLKDQVVTLELQVPQVL
jgi:hypothetical protein